MPANPDEYRTWIGITRDVVVVGLGTFMLIFETAFARSPNPYIIGAALTTFGLPSAIRLDSRNSKKKAADDS